MPGVARYVFSASNILAPAGFLDALPSASGEIDFKQAVLLAAVAEESIALPDLLLLAERYPEGTPAPDGYEWLGFRALINAFPEELWTPAARALALLNWKGSTLFCGKCGALNGDKPGELARLCSRCGALAFPRLSPAVLVAVIKDGTLLLARNVQSKLGFFSLIAGFVEPGETLEDCAIREVMEEVGIQVDGLEYLGSQPWPFPDQLMVGFSARWVSGELKPDGVEIAESAWFSPDAQPSLPNSGSLSRRIIDKIFLDKCRCAVQD